MRYIVAIIALTALAVPVLAELPRHTPNFPTNTTTISIADLLNMFQDPQVASLVRELANMSEDCDKSIKGLVERGLLEPGAGLRLLELLNSPLQEITEGLDPSLRSNVEEALKPENLDPDKLKELLSTLLELRERGILNPYHFIALAKMLVNAFRSLNLEIPAELSGGVIRSLIEVAGISQSLTSSSAGTVDIRENPSSYSLGGIGWLPELRASLPQAPRSGLSDAWLWTSLSIPLTLIVALGLAHRRALLKHALKLKSFVSGALSPRRLPQVNDVISAYWVSVQLVEKFSRVRKLDYLTHREYLEHVVKKSLDAERWGEIVECFKEITKLYEIRRYGQESEDTVAGKARERVAELVRLLGRP